MPVDFSQLTKRPAGEAKRPAALPIGDYQGIIKSFELGDSNKNKTPYVRFHLALTEAPSGVELPDGTDLAKRQMRRDYFFTDDALWRLDEMIRSVGVKPEGRTYEECIPDCVGAHVLVEVQQYVNQSTSEIGNQVGKLVGAA